MKIIETKMHRYEVKKPFVLPGGQTAKVGDVIGLDDGMGIDLSFTGKVSPVAVPEVGQYKAILSFTFEVNNKLIWVKVGELIEVKKADAIRLMFSRKILPCNPERLWSPYHEKKRRATFIDSFKIGKKEVKVVRPVPEQPVKKKPFITNWKKR